MHIRRSKSELDQHNQRLGYAARQPHRRTVPEGDVFDSRLENEIGRLFYRGQITAPEYGAAVRYRSTMLGYLASIGAPYPFCESVDSDSPVAGPMAMPDDETCEYARASYLAARQAIARVGGRRVQDTLDSVIVYEGATGYELAYLRAGLRALVKHYEAQPYLRLA